MVDGIPFVVDGQFRFGERGNSFSLFSEVDIAPTWTSGISCNSIEKEVLLLIAYGHTVNICHRFLAKRTADGLAVRVFIRLESVEIGEYDIEIVVRDTQRRSNRSKGSFSFCHGRKCEIKIYFLLRCQSGIGDGFSLFYRGAALIFDSVDLGIDLEIFFHVDTGFFQSCLCFRYLGIGETTKSIGEGYLLSSVEIVQFHYQGAFGVGGFTGILLASGIDLTVNIRCLPFGGKEVAI